MRARWNASHDEVIKRIQKFGGATTFFITDTQLRAIAWDQLRKAGVIVRNGGAYPWEEYLIDYRAYKMAKGLFQNQSMETA